MRVVFAGTPEVAVPALHAIAESRHELVGVVTRPDAPAGRGRKLVASPVAQRAEELGVPLLKPEHPRDPEFQEALKQLRPDCCPVVAYGALLPQSALDIPPHGWVNLHFSCLPAPVEKPGIYQTRQALEAALAHPHYGWERNMGYGTREHVEALRTYGPTPHHRRSFAPVAQLEMFA